MWRGVFPFCTLRPPPPGVEGFLLPFAPNSEGFSPALCRHVTPDVAPFNYYTCNSGQIWPWKRNPSATVPFRWEGAAAASSRLQGITILFFHNRLKDAPTPAPADTARDAATGPREAPIRGRGAKCEALVEQEQGARARHGKTPRERESAARGVSPYLRGGSLARCVLPACPCRSSAGQGLYSMLYPVGYRLSTWPVACTSAF